MQAGAAPGIVWDLKSPDESVVSEEQELQKRRKPTRRVWKKGEFVTFALLLSAFFPLLDTWSV